MSARAGAADDARAMARSTYQMSSSRPRVAAAIGTSALFSFSTSKGDGLRGKALAEARETRAACHQHASAVVERKQNRTRRERW
jgi:hypothetical protein